MLKQGLHPPNTAQLRLPDRDGAAERGREIERERERENKKRGRARSENLGVSKIGAFWFPPCGTPL